jgi:hypothetical protein
MAAPSGIFADRFSRLLEKSPIHGPVVATYSKWDYALNLWHRIREREPAVGAVGARGIDSRASDLRLKRLESAYRRDDFESGLINVDGSWRLTRGRWFPGVGSHSEYLVDEVFHLLASLISLTREPAAGKM